MAVRSMTRTHLLANGRRSRTTGRLPDINGKELLAAMLEYIPCEVAAISPAYEVLKINKEFTRLTGIRAHDLQTQRCYEVLGAGRPCPGCPVKKALATKTAQKNVRRQRTANKKNVYIEQTALPMLDDDGSVAYVIEISRDITPLVKLEEKNKKLYLETVTAFARLIDSRDHSTGRHSAGVRDIAVDIGREMDLPPETLDEISIAALLHDIGKIGVPEEVLTKPGRLKQHEYHIIQKHSQIGYEALVNISALSKLAEYILYHHEAYDGQGYPAKKRGEEIPLISRILSVADVYEAITADRVYRPAMTAAQAIRIMHEGRGTKFDPKILDCFWRVLIKKGLPVKKVLAEIDAAVPADNRAGLAFRHPAPYNGICQLSPAK